MIYARQTFAFLAMLFLLGLGIFSFAQNPRAKLNRLFALYCLCNLTWNADDFTIFIQSHDWALVFYRFTGIAACFIAPTLVHFIYTVLEINHHPVGRKVIATSYTAGAIMACLSLTSLVFKDIVYQPFKSGVTEVPGVLYPLFAAYFLTVLLCIGIPAPKLLKKSVGVQRFQFIYILLALTNGVISLLVYLYSFVGHDWPWIYYPFQSLASFFFAYAIFKYNLIPARIFARRAALLFGIYVVIAMLLLPIIYWFQHLSFAMYGVPIGLVVLFALTMGIIFSLGPLAYTSLVKHYSLFQDSAASQITHEFKTPLAAIQSAKAILDEEMAAPNKDPKKIQSYMEIIERNTDRLQQFVNAVLNFNRVKESSRDQDLEEIDLESICNEVLRDAAANRTDITLTVTGTTTLWGSREGMKQVFSNLLSNARKFCPNGKIEIRIHKTPEHTAVSVRDHGSGIPRANLGKVFEPFFKTDAPDRTPGSGLGLAIAKKWIEFHHGNIWVESDGEGKGTTVTFTLPK